MKAEKECAPTVLIFTLQHTYVLNKTRIIDIFMDKNPIFHGCAMLCSGCDCVSDLPVRSD